MSTIFWNRETAELLHDASYDDDWERRHREAAGWAQRELVPGQVVPNVGISREQFIASQNAAADRRAASAKLLRERAALLS